jgi:hypothetical protein
MNANLSSTAVSTAVDSLDAAAASLSPVWGQRTWFDSGIYYVGDKTKQSPKGALFYVKGLAEAWQKLQAGQQPIYIMRTPGKAPPPRPEVPENEWPKDLSGKP